MCVLLSVCVCERHGDHVIMCIQADSWVTHTRACAHTSAFSTNSTTVAPIRTFSASAHLQWLILQVDVSNPQKDG